MLHGRGFKGSFPEFKRITSDRIHLLGFQFSQWGSQFCVNIATAPVEGITYASGEYRLPETIKIRDTLDRARLGAIPPNVDHWFDFDCGNQAVFDTLAFEIMRLIDSEAERWWRTERKRPAAGF